MYTYDDDDDDDQDGGRVEIQTGIGKLGSLSVDFLYRVKNGLEVPILLTTPMSRYEKDVLRAAPSRMYAYVDPEGILQLTKRLWVVPGDIDVVFPDVPFVTEVLPGKTFEERMTISLPVRVEIPYLLDPEEFDRKREEMMAVSGGVAFSIGYLVEEHGPLRRGAAPANSGASLTVRYGVAAEHQRILQGGTLQVGVPVKDVKR